MYKVQIPTPSTLKVDESYVAERIEIKVARILNNKEPIKDGAPIIYTERKDGVRPEYNIRTDRFDMAIEATDLIAKNSLLKRELGIGERTFDTMSPEQQKAFNEKFPQNKHAKKDTGGEPAAGTQ